MIKSKDSNIAFSFIMGVDKSITKKLNNIGATYEVEDNKYYLTQIPKTSLNKYEEIIADYLKPGFWNEYISDKVVFMFKTKDNKIFSYELDSNNEQEILKLCNEYANFNKTSVEEMILEEPFYNENTIKY